MAEKNKRQRQIPVRKEQIIIRMTAAEKQKVKKLAASCGMDMSEYIRALIVLGRQLELDKDSALFKNEQILVRITPKEKQEVKKKASSQNMDVSRYIRALIELDKREGCLCRN